MIANTPKPPYYAVIFSSLKTASDLKGYEAMAIEMDRLVQVQPGYLGHESAREGLGITVSYWNSLEAISNWKKVSEHLSAQTMGKSTWYQAYKTRICRVERDYGFENECSIII